MAAKTRKANWSAAETAVLVEMCTSNGDILNGKFSGTLSAADWTKFWAKCGEKVNSIGGANRSVVEVLKKWNEMKSATMKKERKRVFEARQTGRGPSGDKLNELEEKILSVLPSVVIEGIEGGVDTFQGGSDSNVLQPCIETENKENELSTSQQVAEKPDFGKKRKLSDQRCQCSEKLLKIEEAMLQESKNTTSIGKHKQDSSRIIGIQKIKKPISGRTSLFQNL